MSTAGTTITDPTMAAQNYGLIAAFDTAPGLYRAAEKVRDAGFRRWDCITPFPVHGLDKAMGVKRSIVPRISLVGGITGFITGMTMIWWTGAYDYKLVVGGKPLFSPMFAFPVSYELTILFTAFATIGGMFVLNGLPMHANVDVFKHLFREQWNYITAHPNTWGHTLSNYVNSRYVIKKLQVLSSMIDSVFMD